jgi:hypothetical protein
MDGMRRRSPSAPGTGASVGEVFAGKLLHLVQGFLEHAGAVRGRSGGSDQSVVVAVTAADGESESEDESEHQDREDGEADDEKLFG